MEKITIITAFFDIGRKNFQTLPRDNSKYFKDFEFWARVKNQLVVYTEKCFEKEIFDIRKKFGQENNTRIVVVDDIEKIEPNIFSAMAQIESNHFFKSFRFLPNALSGKAKYSYLMMLKAWFINDAVTKGYAQSNLVAWIDFGFNHGGAVFSNPSDFNFEWNFDFSPKIHLFYLRDPKGIPVFEIIRRLDDFFMGCLIVLHRDLCAKYWELTKEAMKTINDVGFIDDDQLLLILAYRQAPESFEIHSSDWFLPLKEYGGSHLQLVKKIEKTPLRRFLSRFLIDFSSKQRYKSKVRNYLKATKKGLKIHIYE